MQPQITHINSYTDLIKKLNQCKTVKEALKLAELYEIREDLISTRIAIMHANYIYGNNLK